MEHISKKEEKKRIEADKRMQAIKEKYLKKYATNIKWDTDGDTETAESLPKEICIDEIIGIYEGTDEQEDIISDFITEKTGFCHYGYDIIIK